MKKPGNLPCEMPSHGEKVAPRMLLSKLARPLETGGAQGVVQGLQNHRDLLLSQASVREGELHPVWLRDDLVDAGFLTIR